MQTLPFLEFPCYNVTCNVTNLLLQRGKTSMFDRFKKRQAEKLAAFDNSAAFINKLAEKKSELEQIVS